MIDIPQHFSAIDTAPTETNGAFFVVYFSGALSNTKYIQYLLGGSITVTPPAIFMTGTSTTEIGGNFIVQVG